MDGYWDMMGYAYELSMEYEWIFDRLLKIKTNAISVLRVPTILICGYEMMNACHRHQLPEGLPFAAVSHRRTWRACVRNDGLSNTMPISVWFSSLAFTSEATWVLQGFVSSNIQPQKLEVWGSRIDTSQCLHLGAGAKRKGQHKKDCLPSSCNFNWSMLKTIKTHKTTIIGDRWSWWSVNTVNSYCTGYLGVGAPASQFHVHQG